MSIEINHSQTRGPNIDDFLNLTTKLSCIVPICLYSYMANRSFLQEYIPWVVSKSLKTKIIIGDYLERHNIMAFDGITEDEAIHKAKLRGAKVKRIIESILSEIPSNNTVTVDSCRTDIDMPNCRDIANNLRAFIENNPRFKMDLEQQTELMLKGNRRLSINSQEEIKTASIHQLHEYMIEEIALYIHLYNHGFTVEVYPGRDMKILQKIATAQYKDFPYDFSERTHISVSVLLDSGTSYAQLDNNDEGDK